MNETYRIDISLLNPLPADLTVHRIEILQEGSEVTSIAARETVLPAGVNTIIPIYVIPRKEGEMILRGVRVRDNNDDDNDNDHVDSYWQCLE